MDLLPQLLVMGLSSGCTYALIGLAMVIIYKTNEILNFAQGELAMFSTFVAYTLLVDVGLPFSIAFLAALGFAMLLGASCEFLFLQPARERTRAIPLVILWAFALFVVVMSILPDKGVPWFLSTIIVVFAVWMTLETLTKRPPRQATVLGLIIVTLGLEMILYGLAGWIWGASQESMPSPVSDLSVHTVGGIVISDLNLLVFAASILLMVLLFAFFRYTRIGIAMKATAENPLAARLMGVRTTRIMSLTWAISSLIGAIGGMLIASAQPIDPNLMLDPLLKGFAAAVLGGMTSLPGVVLGGCILGIVENLVAGFFPDGTQFKSTVAFLVIVLVLCIRPSGILGKHFIKKV